MIRKRKKQIQKRKRGCRGSVSVLLSIILLPCLTFTGLMVDYANITMSKAVAESAGELAVNAALANYDAVLADVYGLFTMSQNEEELSKNLEEYFNNTLSANGLLPESSDFSSETFKGLQEDLQDYLGTVTAEDVNRNFLQVESKNFTATGVEGSAINEPGILKNQIVEFMKYRGPAEVGLDMINSLNAFKIANEKTKVAEKKMDVDTAINDLSEISKEFYEVLVEYDKLMENFQKAEREFQDSCSALNQKMQEANELLVTKIYAAPSLEAVEYVVYGTKEIPNDDGTVSTVDDYTVETTKSSEKNYETLLGKINAQMIAMANNESTLESSIGKAQTLSIEEKVTIYPVFSEYMLQVEELEKMSLKLETFDETNYNLKKETGESQADYEERTANEVINQAQVLKEIEVILENVYSKIQAAYSEGYEGYKAEIEAAKDELKARLSDVYAKVTAYYSAANDLVNSTKSKEGWQHLQFWEEEENFLDYVINLGEAVKLNLKNVETENDNFAKAAESYGENSSQDEYYNTMKSEAEKNSKNFIADDVNEIIEQLEAARNYIAGENGVIALIKSWTFYEQSIWDGSIDTADEAISASKGIFDSMGDEFSLSNSVTYFNIYFPSKFRTNIENYAEGFFAKQIKQADFKVGNITYNVPAYYLYLASTYAKEETEDNSDTNVKKTVQNINTEAKNEAAKEEVSDISYEYTVFDTLLTNNGTDASSSEFDDIDESNTGILKQFKNMSKTAKNIFSALTGGLENARDNLLVTEYLFQNFSYATYDKQDGFKADKPKFKTMTMQTINKNNNTIYGCEIEYILKGYRGSAEKTEGWWIFKKTKAATGPEDNIAMVKADIFAIRFVMNSIYALTAGDLDAQTLAPAMSIQAATGGLFPYQVAQVVLKLCLALAETTIDMQELMSGKDVPLIKTQTTWNCSVAGMIEKAKEKAIEKAVEISGDVIKSTSDYLQQCINNTGEWTNKKTKEITEGITGEIESSVTAALDEAIGAMTQIAIDEIEISYTEIFTEATGYSSTELRRKIKEKLTAYITEAGFSEDVSSFITGKMDDMISGILGSENEDGTVSNLLKKCSNDFVSASNGTIQVDSGIYNQLITKAGDSANAYIATLTKDINEKVTDMTSSLINDVTGEVNKVISSKSDAAAKQVEEKISSFMNEKFPQSNSVVTLGGTKQTTSGKIANIFTFSYKDYLKLFVFLGLSGEDENAMLRRIADVIELNVDLGLKDYYDETGISKVENFSMSKAYTYVQISTDIHVKPLLLSQEIFMHSTGEKGTVNFWSYQYENIAGY